MKFTLTNYLRLVIILFGALSIMTFASCDDDDDDATPQGEDPISSFQFEISEDNFLKVTFTNYSQNATSYSWDFGDGNMATDKDVVHEYTSSGTFTVVLTAKNDAGVSVTSEKSVTITDPNEALLLLTGGSSKTWKLYRVGSSMGVGDNESSAGGSWSLTNDGSRPCVYKQEWTFNQDGTFTFNDNGLMWGESHVFGAFNGNPSMEQNEICFEADASKMVNNEGVDVSAWLSGTFNYSYDPSLGQLTLTGNGAWIGLVKVTSMGDVKVPQASVTYDVVIEEMDGFDLMHISVTGNGFYWNFEYASYDNPADEPTLVEEQAAWGEDLPDLTPTEMFYSFASKEEGALAVLDTISSGSYVILGVDDPAGGDAKVGEFHRTSETWQELKFMTAPEKNDIIFSNFTMVSVEVYFPSSNDYSGDLAKTMVFGIAESSETKEWWNGHIEWSVAEEDIVLDEWKTYTFQLDSPTGGAAVGQYTPFSRNDLDMMYIGLGGGGHSAEGTFYIRNFKFE